MLVGFFVYAADGGALLSGLTPDFDYYRRRNANGSVTDLDDPAITENPAGSGRYEFTIVDADLEAGSFIDYVIDCGATAAARYLEGHVEADEEAEVPTIESNPLADFIIKRGDLKPSFTHPLRDPRGAFALADDATVQFHMYDAEGTEVIDAAATIVDRATATVRYDWQAGDTDTVGVYSAEFVVSDGPRTLPAASYLRIEVVATLAD